MKSLLLLTSFLSIASARLRATEEERFLVEPVRELTLASHDFASDASLTVHLPSSTHLDRSLGVEKDLLNAHNQVREAEGVGLESFKWSKQIAKIAQAHADRCVWQSNGDRGYLGENLYLIGSTEVDVERVVSRWARGKQYWDFESKTCEGRNNCGSWKQLVSSATTMVGCGITTCDTIDLGGGYEWEDATIIVCDYHLPGNIRDCLIGKMVRAADGCKLTSFIFSPSMELASIMRVVVGTLWHDC